MSVCKATGCPSLWRPRFTVLSSYRPVAVVKGASMQGSGVARASELLVILQFAILVSLIFA